MTAEAEISIEHDLSVSDTTNDDAQGRKRSNGGLSAQK